MEIIDGTTIKRLINADGRTPQPPDPAYQQILHGLPAADFTTDELIYRPRNPRAHKLYGYSPVEQVVMTVNIALRRQLYQLSYFTEGNVPEALIGTPEAWSPAQIKEFQQYWDALLEGNLGQRRHAKFVPGGVAKTFIPTKEVELKSAYDEWLARVICFAFSISPQAFSDHMNRATAETAHDTALAEGLAPLQNWIKQLVDYVIITEFAAPDLEFQWRDDRETDPQQAAGIAQIYVTNGIKTINEIRSDIGLDPVKGGDTPMVFTGTGPVPLTQIGAGLGKVFNPGEPRVPAGSGRTSGDWTNDGGYLQPAQEIILGRPPIFARPPWGRIPVEKRPFQERIPKQSPKEGAKNPPERIIEKYGPPRAGETPNEYAKRVMDNEKGPGNYGTGPSSEYSQIKKWTRGFRDPKSGPPSPDDDDDDRDPGSDDDSNPGSEDPYWFMHPDDRA